MWFSGSNIVGCLWYVLTIFIVKFANGSHYHYSSESDEWDEKFHQLAHIAKSGKGRVGCGLDTVLIGILLFLPLVGLLGMVAPLMLFIFPLLIGTPQIVPTNGNGINGDVVPTNNRYQGVNVGRRRRSTALQRFHQLVETANTTVQKAIVHKN